MPRGRGGMKAPVQPEDGSSVGIHRLKRVADFGPPTVGTLPVRNKKPKRGRGGGPPAASGSSDSGRGSWGSSSNRGSAPRGRGGGGGGRGRGRGSPSDGGRSWRASSPYDKGKGRDEGWGGRREDEYRGGSGSGSGSSRYDRSRDRDRDRERPGRDYGRSYDRDYDRNYDRDRRDRDRRRDDAREDNVDKEEMYANQPPLHPSLPPRPVSTHTRWDSSPIAYQHPPSLPAGGISESESVVELLSSSPQGSALHLDDVAPPVAGPSRPVASGSGSRQPDAPADAPQPKPPKFTPRNHNARANEPQPPPPPPKEPTPPPPEPPKFKPKNHNQRRNDPTPQSRPAPAPPAQPAARRPSPPASHRILTSPELPTWLEPQLPQFRQPPQQPQPQRHRSKSRQQSQPPAPAPAPPPPKSKSPVIPTYVPSTSDEEPEPEDIKPDITALAEAKLAALETEPPPRTRSPQREGVLWIKPEEIPADCLGSGVGPKRAERMAARKAFVVAQRRKLLQAGKVVVSSKWRSDGLAIDWRLKEYIPPETNESSDDDDFIEVVPPPKQPTPEHIVVEDDTPSPPAHAPAPLPPAAALVPPGPPAPVVLPEPDLSQPGVTTIPLPPRYTMAAARKTPAFAVWVDNQLEKFRAAPVTVEHTTTFNGLRIRWEPVEEPECVAGPVPSVQESVAPAPIAQSDAPPAPSSNTVTQLLSSLAEPSRAPGTIAEPLLNSNQPDAVAGSTILPAAVATVDPLFAQPAASTPALIPSSPLDFSTLGLGLPPSFPSLSSSPARPSDTTTSQVTNAVQWLDTSALERAVAEATSAVGLNPSPPKPPPPPVPTGSALGLIPPSDDIPLSSTTTPAAPLLNPSPPAALASKSPVEPTASPVTLPDAAAAAPSAADRLAQLQTQLNGLFDRIDRWMRLQEDFPDRAEQLQRQIERTELSIFEVQNQMDVEKRRMEAERAPPA